MNATVAQQLEAHLKVWIDGEPWDDAQDRISLLEVEERTLGASTLRMVLEMAPRPAAGEATDDDDVRRDWDILEDERFTLLRRVTISLGVGPRDEDATVLDTVFDGYITAIEPVFAVQRMPESTLELHGMDAFSLMHLVDRQRAWEDLADSDIVKAIYEEYGFDTDVEATPTSRALQRDTIVQRTTDAEFVKMLARRNGYEAFTECIEEPTAKARLPGKSVVGHFHKPRLGTDLLQTPLTLMPAAYPSLRELRARWESHRPMAVHAEHNDTFSRRVTVSDVTTTDLRKLGKLDRTELIGESLSELLPSAVTEKLPGDGTKKQAVGFQHEMAPHDATEVNTLAWAALLEADWLAEATGTVEGHRYEGVMRSRRPVSIAGGGNLVDGDWYVRMARHQWDLASQLDRYTVAVELVRNGLGEVSGGA